MPQGQLVACIVNMNAPLESKETNEIWASDSNYKDTYLEV